MIVTAGKANVTVDVYFVDDDGGTSPGEPTTGLLFSNIETGGSASYHRQGAARVDFTLVTVAVAGAHTDGGFIEIDAANMPGLYRLDVPDAAFLTGVDYVTIQLVEAGGNNTLMRPLLIDLTDVDLRDSVRGGMTALPNAAADDVGGLPISDAGGLDLDTQLAETNEITAARMGALTDWLEAGRLDAILDIIAADVVNLDGQAMRGTDNALLAASAPTNFSDMSITVTTGLVDITQAAADKVWATASRTLTALGSSLALEVWHVLESAVVTASTMGLKVKTNLDAVLSDVEADTQDIQSRLPAALVGGAMDSDVSAMQAGVLTAAAVATDAIDADALAGDAATEIADAILARDIGSGTGAGSLDERTVRAALRFLRNKWSIAGSTLTVTEEDDTTTAWTGTITTDAAADPITGNDPA